MSGVRLPDSLLVLERGWLSSNNVIGFEADGSATLVDSGYVSHAAQTVALVARALDGRPLRRLLNTHAHSDHIGGNAALQAAFACRVSVPAGHAAMIAEWDEDALLLSPLGQRAARFAHDDTLAPGDRVRLGDLEWSVLAVPGHDMDALAFHNADHGLLISGDALWADGFGVIFPELLGQPGGMAATRATLECIGRLSLTAVIPGHGAPFADCDAALERAFRKLAAFEADADRLARHALKVMFAFFLLERRQFPRDGLPALLGRLSFVRDVNQRYLGLDEEQLADWLCTDLARAGVLRVEEGQVLAR